MISLETVFRNLQPFKQNFFFKNNHFYLFISNKIFWSHKFIDIWIKYNFNILIQHTVSFSQKIIFCIVPYISSVPSCYVMRIFRKIQPKPNFHKKHFGIFHFFFLLFWVFRLFFAIFFGKLKIMNAREVKYKSFASNWRTSKQELIFLLLIGIIHNKNFRVHGYIFFYDILWFFDCFQHYTNYIHNTKKNVKMKQ